VRHITVTRYTVSAIKVPRQYQLALLVKVACLNIVLTCIPYLKENTTLYHYNDQLVNAVTVMVAVYSENHMKPVMSVGKLQNC
jgi:hypothetical protein